MHYQADFESEWHPVPLVVHQEMLTGLIQPFLAGTKVQYYAIYEEPSDETVRIPQTGTFRYKVDMDLGSRVRHRIRRLIK